MIKKKAERAQLMIDHAHFTFIVVSYQGCQQVFTKLLETTQQQR
jgi:hypothetical protein